MTQDANGDPADDDAALVRATLAGRAQAFGLLYDRYAPLVRALCFDEVRDLTQAQDLAQEAFLRAFRELPRLRVHEQFAPWVTGIARHVCREWRRGAGRRRRHLRRVAEFGDVGTGADPAEHRNEASGGDADRDELCRVRDAIAALPRREREALHLFYLSEQPADAAAKVLGLSRSGFYRALERARARVQRILGLQRTRNGVTP
jgi:RNA polymerase sigma factor (sigma-70 family)